MNEETITRIADALEQIAASLAELESLSDLASCISKSRAGDQFCITGNVTNYGI